MSKVRYQALGPLLSGEGSRAFLGLATNEGEPTRPVVMIWVPPETAKDPEQVQTIQRETLRATGLEHPNIIRVFGLASLDEGLARVVEFADGESLRKVREVAGQIPPPFAALLIADAATGLHYAHMAGNDDGSPLVHGDIRPETLMVCFSGFTKVSGYGALSVAPRESGGQRVIHRRMYSAPEQIIGGRTAISVQTDVYLLGVTLYECLTGLIPFEGEANRDQAIVQKPLTFAGYPEIPPKLVPVLQRATSKRSNERYSSVVALRENIEEVMGPLPSHEEFAEWLGTVIPEGDANRAARRRVLDAGLADYARKSWDPRATSSGMLSAVQLTPDPPAGAPRASGVRAAVAAAKPATAAAKVPARANTALERSSGETSLVSPPARRSRLAVVAVILASLAIIAVAVSSVMNKQPRVVQKEDAKNQPLPPSATLPPTRPPPSEKPGVEPEPVGVPSDNAPDATASALPKPVEKPKPVVEKPVEPPKPVKPPEPPSVILSVQPAVDVAVDGKAAGHTPVTLNLSPGKHRLRLRDKATGLDSVREIVVARSGKQKVDFAFKQGFLTVNIPDGAVINLDGRKVGTRSVIDLPIWEGGHHLYVMLGDAKWTQDFDVKANEHMKYDVKTQAQ